MRKGCCPASSTFLHESASVGICQRCPHLRRIGSGLSIEQLVVSARMRCLSLLGREAVDGTKLYFCPEKVRRLARRTVGIGRTGSGCAGWGVLWFETGDLSTGEVRGNLRHLAGKRRPGSGRRRSSAALGEEWCA